jgi:predicted permease
MQFQRWLYTMPRRLRSLFLRKRVDRELDDELRDHVEKKTALYVANGMTPEAARRQALMELGGIEQAKENCRDQRRVAWLQDLPVDVIHGLRQFRRNPGLTFVALATLALGIGATTAIYSITYSVLLKDLPVRNPQQLAVLRARFSRFPVGYGQNGDGLGSTFSFRAYRAFSQRGRVFASVFGFAPPDIGKENLTVEMDGHVSTANGVMVTGSYFSGLGVTPFLGRAITHMDEKPGAPRVADVGYGYWVRAFGRSPSVVGKSIFINKTPFTIVGVLPRDFSGLQPGDIPDFWIPVTATANLSPWGGMSPSQVYEQGKFAWLTVIARLAPGVSRTQAAAAVTPAFQQDLQTSLGRRLHSREIPQVELLPGGRGLDSLRKQFSMSLAVSMALAGFLLLLASANVAALLLAQGAARQGEMATRSALGANRGRLVRQLLTEGVVLAVAGGIAALAVVWEGSRALVTLLSSGRNHISLHSGLGSHTVFFLAAASLLASVLVGIVPALRGAAAAPASVLKSVGASRTDRSGPTHKGWGNALAVAQIALSVLLLVAAGLFLRTLANAEAEKTGINPHHLLLFSTNPVGYGDPQAQALYERLVRRFRAVPGVRSVTVSALTLFSGWISNGPVVIVGYHARPGQNMQVDFLPVGPRFFRTMGIPRIAGSGIEKADIAKTPKAAVVNEAFARKFFGGASPIGQAVVISKAQVPIVGLVADAKYGKPIEKTPPIVYLPTDEGYFEVRTQGDPRAIVPAIRTVMRAVAPGVPLMGVETQTHQISGWFSQQRLLASLGAFFGLLGLLLAVLGIYGLMSFRAARLTREIGIRMALGAQRSDVLRSVVGQGLKLTLFGVAIGILGALGLTRFLATLLFGVKPVDPLTFAVVSLVLLAVAALACLIPAHRAAKVDPMVALRYE